MKKRDGDDGTEEMSVLDYFVNVRKIDLRYSADLPCINVGRPKRPTYFPIEVIFSFSVCFIVSYFLTVILITYLVITLPLFIFTPLAVRIGIVATIYKISVHTSKGFISGEVQTEATGEDENID